MQSPFCFLVKPLSGKRYNNTKEVSGIELILNTSEEDHKFSNREAIVVGLPLRYTGDIRVGDTLLVHHNVFKFYNDMKGNRKSGKSFFKDDEFLIDDDQCFMYKNETGWHPIGNVSFVSPVKAKDSYIGKNIKYEPLIGIMEYPSANMISKGVNKGDTISFDPDSEYEFNIDGRVMYRIYDHRINMKL